MYKRSPDHPEQRRKWGLHPRRMLGRFWHHPPSPVLSPLQDNLERLFLIAVCHFWLLNSSQEVYPPSRNEGFIFFCRSLEVLQYMLTFFMLQLKRKIWRGLVFYRLRLDFNGVRMLNSLVRDCYKISCSKLLLFTPHFYLQGKWFSFQVYFRCSFALTWLLILYNFCWLQSICLPSEL